MIGNQLMGCLLSNPTYNQNTINTLDRMLVLLPFVKCWKCCLKWRILWSGAFEKHSLENIGSFVPSPFVPGAVFGFSLVLCLYRIRLQRTCNAFIGKSTFASHSNAKIRRLFFTTTLFLHAPCWLLSVCKQRNNKSNESPPPTQQQKFSQLRKARAFLSKAKLCLVDLEKVQNK